MGINITDKINAIAPSATLALSTKAKEMQAQGIDVINLSIGEPDFNTPEHIKQAAIAAITAGKSDFYTPALGIKELRSAIATKVTKMLGVPTSDDQVAVTAGGKFSLYAVTQAVISAGDEVLIPLPYWVSYGEQVKLAAGKPVFVRPTAATGRVSVADLEANRTDRTKLLIINSPQNPAGLVYTREELQAIGDWAVEHDIVIIADDMYSELIYNGNQFTSIWQLSAAIREQTILVSGFSKTYAMTGWRVGYTVAPQWFIKKLGSFIGHTTSNIAAVSQYAALAAATGPQTCVEEMRLQYEQRLNTIYPLLSAIPGVDLQKPAGAFYMFPNVKKTATMCGYSTVSDFCTALLEQAHVAIVPGVAFGMDEHIRLSYATSMENLMEAVKRLDKFVQQHLQ